MIHRRIFMRAASLILIFLLGAGGMAARAEIEQAWENMRIGRWADAETLLAERGGDDARRKFGEAALWRNRQPGARPEKAIELYREIVREFPESRWAPWALLAEARMADLEVLKPNPQAAIPLYRRVMTDYPDSAAAQEAAIHLAQALWEADGIAGASEGVRELENWKSAQPDANYAPLIDLLLGSFFRYPLEDYPAAVKHLMAALDGLQTLAQRSATCWTVAALAERKLGDPELAVRYYTRFLQDFPNHRLGFRAKEALERLHAPIPPAPDPGQESSGKK